MLPQQNQKSILWMAVNLPRVICNHVVGLDHHITHRMSVGAIIMVIGVVIAKIGSEHYILAMIYDAGGYCLHAIGAIPFIEVILKLRD